MSANPVPSNDGKRSGAPHHESATKDRTNYELKVPHNRDQRQDLTNDEKQAVADGLFIIEWKSNDEGFMECPGAGKHTGADKQRDCKILLGGGLPPTITCFHNSCADEIAEANHTLRSALGKAKARAGAFSPHLQKPAQKPAIAPPPSKIRLDPLELPEALLDPIKTHLEACFEPREEVGWVTATNNGTTPAGAGTTYGRDWLAVERENILNPNGYGLYIRVNPMQENGTKAEHVVDYRHTLIEGDDAPLELQWAAAIASGLPISSVVFSGKRSLHLLVKVDAGDDLAEYKRRRTLAKQALERYEGYEADDSTKDPARLTRLGGGRRGEKTQDLLAVNIGAASWEEWEAERDVEEQALAVTGEQSAQNIPIVPPQSVRLLKDSRGNFAACLANVVTILKTWDRWAGKISYDSFLQEILTTAFGDKQTPQRWTDEMTRNLTLWIQEEFGISTISSSCVYEGVQAYSGQNKRNCLTDWLKSLAWDKRPRLEHWLPLACGTDSDEYNKRVGVCFILSLVARAFEPGCKVDTMPVFEGPQGAGKSSVLRILGGSGFGECHEDFGSKDFVLSLSGKWIVEIAEMHAFKKQDVDRLKGILSTATDRIRRPYGRVTEEVPRQSVFAGTTNRDDWHTDDTGGRRFWPVRCRHIDLEWLRANREQLFAEAVARFNAGEKWWDVPETEAAAQIHERRQADPWEAPLVDFLQSDKTYTIDQLLKNPLEVALDKQTVQLEKRVGAILRGLGWEKKSIRSVGCVGRRWRKQAEM